MEKNRDNIETSGISYKQKLAERRKQKPGGASAAPAESKPQEAQAAPASAPVEPRMEAPPASAAALEPFQQQTQPAAEQYQQVQASQSQQYTPSNSVTADSSPEEIRTSIRTLMGLIIKHRGGPGFGAGGLKENDIAQYEKLVDEVTALLKKETQLNTANQAAAPQAAAPTQTDSANPMYSSAPPATSSTPEGQTAGLVTVPNSPSGGAQVESMLACIEGAILMYRNSPPELKDEVLMQIRAALLSAVNTCNKIMGQHEGIPSSTQGAGTQVDSMFACVEGAMLMYRNSPEELKQGVLMTLRAALLSALNTCNRIIAENEVDNYNQYKDATAGMEKPPITNRPTQFYNVERVEETQSAPSGKDENYKALDAIYSKLEATAGNGKLGLRENLTPEEASDLADSIVELRSILMDELDNGIPQEGAPGHQNSAASAQSSQSASSSGSSTTSRYQEMLAKAREEKASNN